MSQDAGDRVGARPLSAFSTAEIVADEVEEEHETMENTATPIGITPLSIAAVLSSEDTEEEADDEQQKSSILLSPSQDVFGLLQDPHADPPIEKGESTAQQHQQQDELAGSSDDEYHSPLEDNEPETIHPSAKPMIASSPYDYDVNWDMIGHLRQQEQRTGEREHHSEQEPVNTSLADAAAASMLASTAANTPLSEETPSLPQQQPFSFRPSTSSSSSGRRTNLYRYQHYTNSSTEELDGGEEQEEGDVRVESATEQNLMTTMLSPIDITTAATAPSEMNESTASTSSSSAGTTPQARRRRRHNRASSFNATTLQTPTTRISRIPETNTRTSSLDSGMAAVRRWIRSRTSGGSSRAARRWQRESTLQLGEEDLFALTHAGEDPRQSLFPLHEEEVGAGWTVRQRALSEPNNVRMRNFFYQRAAHGPPSTTSSRSFRASRAATRQRDVDDETTSASGSALSNSVSVPTHLSSAALNSSLFHSPQRPRASSDTVQVVEPRVNDGDVSSLAETSLPPSTATVPPVDDDPNREARTRWIRINRRFQLIITVVALIFSLLLFAILVCWVVFTSAYVVSIDKKCDLPLKQYFWLATLQLILDVFRTDIMRFVFRWDTHSNDQIPVRVIMYNIAYLIYALLVLRLGVKSVFVKADDATCPTTAPELYQSSAVFVSLSIAAWSTIVLGYLVPFCFVATLLTWNGYTPTAENTEQNAHPTFVGGVFPAAYSTTGAPPGCVDQLRTVLLEEFPDDYPRECCICMGDFVTGEVIVATECQHVFHKRCCQEWLRQARTCPVCRMDIPSSLANSSADAAEDHVAPPPPTSRLTRPFPGREDFQQDVVGLLQILRRQEHRLRQGNADVPAAPVHVESSAQHNGTPTASGRSESLPVVRTSDTEMVSLEEGRVNRQHSR